MTKFKEGDRVQINGYKDWKKVFNQGYGTHIRSIDNRILACQHLADGAWCWQTELNLGDLCKLGALLQFAKAHGGSVKITHSSNQDN